MLIPAENLLLGLKDYSNNPHAIPQLAERIRGIENLESFVEGLSEEQKSGKVSIIDAYQPPISKGDGGCKLDIYWNQKEKGISIDWSDISRGNPMSR